VSARVREPPVGEARPAPEAAAGPDAEVGGTRAFPRGLRQVLEPGLQLPDALARAVGALHARRAGRCARSPTPLLDFLYERWWRVEATGVHHVPSHGRALLTANHAGILPWDATMISLAILREHRLPHHPGFLVLDWAFDLRYVSVAMRVAEQRGAAAGARGAGGRLPGGREGRGQAVWRALPAPALRPRRVRRDRAAHRRPHRAGRRGGSQEIYPKLAELPPIGRLIEAPYFPVTPTGPLGVVPLRSR
jgi:hypothetical protein